MVPTRAAARAVASHVDHIMACVLTNSERLQWGRTTRALVTLGERARRSEQPSAVAVRCGALVGKRDDACPATVLGERCTGVGVGVRAECVSVGFGVLPRQNNCAVCGA